MRLSILALALLLLGACSGGGPPRLGEGPAGLPVARAALASGSADIALNVVNPILAREPRNLGAILTQADALSQLGRHDEAQASYSKALVVEPDSTEAQLGLARLQLGSEPAKAQELFLKVLKREPRNGVALNDLGIAYDLQGEHASAQAAYRHALGANPTMRAAEVNLALSMALSGQAPEAVRILQPLATGAATPRRLRHDFAVALALSGNPDAAARTLAGDMTPEQVEHAVQAFGALGP